MVTMHQISEMCWQRKNRRGRAARAVDDLAAAARGRSRDT
jgi:hypothetical protein